MFESRRLRVAILLALLPWLIPFSMAYPCGMSTHAEVCTRAAHYFSSETRPEYKELLTNNPDAYQAGSAFPDWGYAFGYPDESEEAHWPPFLEAFAGYVHDTYPKPWDEETKRLVAFYLGIISHDIADIDWHGLAGVQEGFIDVMSEQEFHGDWGMAHNAADTGGDAVEGFERDMDWLAVNWYVPVEDAAAVYRRMGFESVTAEVLEPRTFLLFLGAVANKVAGVFLYRTYASDSTFLAEQFQDYFVGGLDDMAIRTTWWWETYVEMMENGLTGNVLGGAGRSDRLDHDGTLSSSIRQGLIWWEQGLLDVEEEHTERGVIYRARVRTGSAATAETEAREDPGMQEEGPDLTFFTDTPYSYLGRDLAGSDFNQDGFVDLVLGAPGYGEDGEPQLGAVYLFYGRPDVAKARLNVSEADLILKGPETFGRFGWSLAVADLNADGLPDLAVSAPTSGARDRVFDGKVFIYFGNGQNKGLSQVPDVTIQGVETYSNLGWSLGTGDTNGDGYPDLLIGAPYARAGGEQRGLAAVFFSSSSLTSGDRLLIEDADWIESGAHDYDWFGYAVENADLDGDRSLLLVGAPGRDEGQEQAVGALFAFDLAAADPDGPVFGLKGERAFDKTGAAFVADRFYGDSRTILILSAPTRNVGKHKQAGAGYIIPLGGLAGEIHVQDLDGVRAFKGDQDFGRLGWALCSGDVNGDNVPDLLITKPWKNRLTDVMSGAGFLWIGGSRFSSGARATENAAWEINGSRKQARLGDAAVLADFNGDGFDDRILAASRDSGEVRHGGAVFLYLTPPCVDLDGDGYGDPSSSLCPQSQEDCVDDPANDPAVCNDCACGYPACAGCARCIHPNAREFPGDGIDSNCNGDEDCFLATVSFGTAAEGKLRVLRRFRDRYLLTHPLGRSFVRFYYARGPVWADCLSRHAWLKPWVRVFLLPLVGFVSLLP